MAGVDLGRHHCWWTAGPRSKDTGVDIRYIISIIKQTHCLRLRRKAVAV